MTTQTHDYSSNFPLAVDGKMIPCAVAFIAVWYICLDY